MINISVKASLFYIILACLFSCNSYYNSKKLQTISHLEQVLQDDEAGLKKININDIHNILKIASFNLSVFESKKIDSIGFEILYEDYKLYINCVNLIHESSIKLTSLKTSLKTNKHQLKKIKDDYMLSRGKRDDLDKYLVEEFDFIYQTSSEIKETISTIIRGEDAFFKLNSKMEKIIYQL